MKILAIHNNHIKKSKPEREYGCVCNKCPNPSPSQCTVRCPNSSCQNIMTLTLCKEFKTAEDKDQFQYTYDE